MKIIKGLQQGSPEWLAHRAKSRNSSEAAAVLGCDPKLSRSALLRMKATGGEREFTEWQRENLLARGHEIEAFARPLAEAFIGEDLYPVTATDDDGYLSMSFDGINMAEDLFWECKSSNSALRAALDAGDLPDSHWPQVEQGMVVSGAGIAVFTISDGTEAGTRHMEYRSRPERRAALLAAWHQFDADLANYVHTEAAPEVIPAPVQGFGALVLHVEGRVVSCNLDDFKIGAKAFLERLPKADELKTDQNFADAEAAVKACSEAEDRIKAAKASAMAQAASIDDVFREVDHVAELIRAARLALNNTVKSRKEQIRAEIIAEGQKALRDHIEAANQRIGKPYMPAIAADFVSAIKGMKKLDNMRDAIADELAKAKVAATEAENRVLRNLTTLRSEAADYGFLFADTAQIILKEPDDLAALVKMRIAEHKEAEAKRAAEKQAAEAAAAAIEAAKASAPPPAAAPTLGQVMHAAAPAAVANAIAPPADNGKTMKLGDMNSLFGFTVTADFLATLGFHPVPAKGVAKTYRDCDFPAICAAISGRLDSLGRHHSMEAAA